MREGARIAAAIEIVGIVLKSNLPLKGTKREKVLEAVSNMGINTIDNPIGLN